jgi:hypothetical protein
MQLLLFQLTLTTAQRQATKEAGEIAGLNVRQYFKRTNCCCSWLMV